MADQLSIAHSAVAGVREAGPYAQVMATLALAEEMRTANMIAYVGLSGTTSPDLRREIMGRLGL